MRHLEAAELLDHFTRDPMRSRRTGGSEAELVRTIRYRIQVSTVDAACRIVAANLAIAIAPREVAGAFRQVLGLRIIPLGNAWARRKFVICVRDDAAFSVPARLLVESLCESARLANSEKSRSEPIRAKSGRRRNRTRR